MAFWGFVYLFRPLSVNVGDEARDGDPKDETDNDHGAHDVVLQELEHRVDVEIVDEVPNSFDHILQRKVSNLNIIEFKMF